MQEKVELVQARSFSELIEDSILFFKQNGKILIKCYFIICGFFWLAGTSSAIINQFQEVQRLQDGESGFSPFYYLQLIFDVFSFTMLTLTVLSFMSLYKEKGNEAPAVEEVWAYVKYYFFRAFGSTFVLLLAIIAGTVCCIIPGIYLWIVLAITLPIMVMENGTLGYSFNRSFQLIKNNWWASFGAIIVIYIIIAAGMVAVAIPVELIVFMVSFLTKAGSLHTYTLTYIVISHLLQFVYMLPVVVTALLYFSLNEQRDEGSLLARIDMLGKHEANTGQHPAEDY